MFTLSLGVNPSGGTLTGTLTVTVVNGVAGVFRADLAATAVPEPSSLLLLTSMTILGTLHLLRRRTLIRRPSQVTIRPLP
jgi:hypothetical protein